MKKKLTWTHKKYPKRKYEASYGYSFNTGRTFLLRGLMKNGQVHGLAFESHEAAKALGWVGK